MTGNVPYYEVMQRPHFWGRCVSIGKFHTPGTAYEFCLAQREELRSQGTRWFLSRRVFVVEKFEKQSTSEAEAYKNMSAQFRAIKREQSHGESRD
jgi:hypothetical protein